MSQGELDTASAPNVLEEATEKLQAMTAQRDGLVDQLTMANSGVLKLRTDLAALRKRNVASIQANCKLTVDLGRAETLLTAVRHDEARATTSLKTVKAQVSGSITC